MGKFVNRILENDLSTPIEFAIQESDGMPETIMYKIYTQDHKHIINNLEHLLWRSLIAF